MKILVADDTDVNRQILQMQLCKDGHSVVLVADGKQAVNQFEKEQPDLILMDLMMPEMDGKEATSLIKQQSHSRFVPVIFLTAMTDERGLAECLAAGGDDILTKPYSRTILRAKLSAWGRVQELHARVTAQKQELEEYRDRSLHEIDVANEIRTKILATPCMERMGINYHVAPAAVLGGDLVLAGTTPTGLLHVFLGDFTGHGLSSAIGALPLADVFYRMTERGHALQDILREINRKLNRTLPVGLFCAASAIEINPVRCRISVWNGGLPPILMVNPNVGVRMQWASQHPPLGVQHDREFNSDLEQHDIQAGDRIMLYTDGVIEARSPSGELFGEARVHDCVKQGQATGRAFKELVAALVAFGGGNVQEDDITVVDVPCDRVTENAAVQIQAPSTKPSRALPWHIEVRLGPDAMRTEDPLPDLMQLVSLLPGHARHRERFFTVLTELISNAIDHGVLGIQSNLKTSPDGFDAYYQERDRRLAVLQDGYVQISLTHAPSASGAQLIVRVEDSGAGFDAIHYAAPLSINDSMFGRGLALVRALCQKVTFHGDGNCVEAIYSWD
ncbi:MAG: fused response regulator/phosphatase [Nitrospira sp.]|jgi:CheY-like chemotaxis protein/anti-sigma regulatory factor (Ser/Thr protein kinase)|nr:fused response regulator/phosphatase [Nitrospira sp.]